MVSRDNATIQLHQCSNNWRTLPCCGLIFCCGGISQAQNNLRHLWCISLHQSQNIHLCHSAWERTLTCKYTGHLKFILLHINTMYSPQEQTYLCSTEWTVLCPSFTHTIDTVTWEADTVASLSLIIYTVWALSLSAGHFLLTRLPCSITLIWHHWLSGTSKWGRNAEDSPLSPSTWMCRCPAHVR